MEQQLKRRALSAAIFAGAIVAAGCSAGASGESASSSPLTTIPESATLHATSSGVHLNDVEVPYGETRPVELDQPIHVDTASVANLGAGDIELVLLGTDFPVGADLRLDSWDRPELRSTFDHGHVFVTVAEKTKARLRLTTATDVVLTTQDPGTQFIVCQTPVVPAATAVTCLYVIKGAVEWEAKGESKLFHAGEGTFTENGEPATEVKCLPPEQVDTWYRAVLRNEPVGALGALVHDALPCPGTDSSESTTTTTSTTIALAPGTQPTTTASGAGRRSPPATPQPTSGTTQQPVGTTTTTTTTTQAPQDTTTTTTQAPQDTTTTTQAPQDTTTTTLALPPPT